MPRLHIANTFFEDELAGVTCPYLQECMHSRKVFLQLQYLPFLYASPEDAVLVTQAPPSGFLENLGRQGIKCQERWHLVSEKPPTDLCVESWGHSRIVENWAKSAGLSYAMPPWELTREVNSKAFSFLHGTRLPYSQLLEDKEQLCQWIKSFDGPKVLKTCYGLSGRGHFHITLHNEKELAQACSFATLEWENKRPVLAEPWVKRVLDFSTQWHISTEGEIQYLGATLCENDSFGRYRATQVGPEPLVFGEHQFSLEQHKKKAGEVLASIAQRGFFGHAGIDAMIYEHAGDLALQPIVEINARKTMGYVALEIGRLHFHGRRLRMALTNADASSSSLLPLTLEQKNAPPLHFPKQLTLQMV